MTGAIWGVPKYVITNLKINKFKRKKSTRKLYAIFLSQINIEETDKIVLGLAADLNIELNQTEIDRSRRVGKPVPSGPAARGPAKRRCRDIIVKFVNYIARDRLFKVRRELGGLGGSKLVYINEDLTRNRSKLLYEARTLVRGNKKYL